MCSTYYHSYGVRTVSLRFSNCYSPYSGHKTSVVAKFLQKIKNGEPLIIYIDEEQTRDFLHVSDICQAITSCRAGVPLRLRQIKEDRKFISTRTGTAINFTFMRLTIIE